MKSFKKFIKENYSCYDHVIVESEYQGRKVKLNDPFRLPSGSKKKFGVYVKNDKGNVVKVTFGDPNMEIKRDDPQRRANFRARHSCDDNPGPKWKARYWSCYQWRSGSKVDEESPCWDGYKQVGMKKKGNKMVPNCVPIGEVKQDKDIKDRKGTQPAKYYAKDAEGDEMAKSTKTSRARYFAKQSKKSDDDPDAYKPAPGDAGAKTKLSKHTKKYKQMFGEKIEGLKKKSEKSGIAYGILKKVYDRGMAAWKTGHRPGTTPQQWAFARVNSFITGGGARKSDNDLWKRHKGK